MVSENYEKALALHIRDEYLAAWTLGEGGPTEQHIRWALDELGLQLVPLRGGGDPQPETLERRSGDS